MFFFIKPSKITIEALISEDSAIIAQEAPVYETALQKAGWFKSLSATSFNWETMSQPKNVKGCIGIINYLKSGIILPMWTDLAFKINKGEYKYQFADMFSSISGHGDQQVLNFYKDFAKLKISSPWVFRCNDSNIKIQLTDPFYLNKEPLPFIIAPGINQFVYKHMLTNLFWFFNKNQQLSFILEKHTPVAQFIPLTDKSIDLKIRVVAEKEYSNLISERSRSFNFNILKRIKDERRNS